MAHVQRRGARWLATYKGADGKRHSRRFDLKRDAEAWIAEQTVDVRAGRWVDPKAGRVTFGEYAAEWVAQRPIRASTRARYRGYLAHTAELDRVALADLRPSTMRTWQAALTGRVAKSTARTIRGVVSSILKSAVIDRLITVSPLDGVARPGRPDRQLVQPYTVERVLALRDGITPRYAAAIVLGAGAGPRRGEAMGLTVDRVDFLRRTVTFDRQLVGATRDGRPIFGPPKTPASVRVVPVAQSVIDALSAHLAAFPATPGTGVFVEADGRERPVPHGGLIFTAPRGGPVTRGKVGEAWRDAEVRVWARANGRPLGRDRFSIPAATLAEYEAAHPDGHGHRFHELRHFYVSRLIEAGASVRVVQDRVGHEPGSPETLRVYAHLWPDSDERTRAAIDAVFAPQGDEAGEAVE